MNKEIEAIILNFNEILNGEPWYGKSANAVLQNINPNFAFEKPSVNSHSLIEVLYHMVTWAEFAFDQVDKNTVDLENLEKKDWREIDIAEHSWEKGLEQFNKLHRQLIVALTNKDDAFLENKVSHRDYNFRYLLLGLIQHNIYHLGQIVYLDKLYKDRAI